MAGRIQIMHNTRLVRYISVNNSTEAKTWLKALGNLLDSNDALCTAMTYTLCDGTELHIYYENANETNA